GTLHALRGAQPQPTDRRVPPQHPARSQGGQLVHGVWADPVPAGLVPREGRLVDQQHRGLRAQPPGLQGGGGPPPPAPSAPPPAPQGRRPPRPVRRRPPPGRRWRGSDQEASAAATLVAGWPQRQSQTSGTSASAANGTDITCSLVHRQVTTRRVAYALEGAWRRAKC